ncbi:MerR family transcriptional regulator [Liquorilactobacillus capillatus]|uniref:MerR family transcriptional regulator n=1 Tax=Liquorilactobacillus capillatus TaxID=480931 RepID=UPI00071056AC|nr:MerR family transcriptional regulator [Liquorilactobacillus capillatus]
MQASYSISNISKITGLSKDTLRYYEKIDLIRNVSRDSAGKRIYTKKNLEWIQFLIKVKATGMSLSTLKQYGNLMSHKNVKNVLKRRQILAEHEINILQKQRELEQALNLIHKKYKIYEQELAELKETKKAT